MKKTFAILFSVSVLFCFACRGVAAASLQQLQKRANALADGGTFSLSESSQISGTLIFKNKSNITIDGHGETITQRKHDTVTIDILDCSNITMKDVVLVGEPSSYKPFERTYGIGVRMRRCAGRHVVYNVKFLDHGCAGFMGVDVSHIFFSKCRFRSAAVNVKPGDVYNSGICSYGTQCANWEVAACTFEKLAIGVGFYLGHDALNIHDNHFTDIRGQHGMYLNASSYVNISRNTLRNVRGVAIKLQMNNGHNQSEKDVYINDNTCMVEDPNYLGQAGIAVGAARPEGPAKGVVWKNVHIENNHVRRAGYGVSAEYVVDANIIHNELTDTVYGVLVGSYSGGIRDNTITTARWSGICCKVMDDLKVDIEGNVIRDAVHITTGDAYKRCGIFLTGVGLATIENNEIYKDGGQPLFGLYQGPGITLTSYHNNRLIGPVELKGLVESQGGNEILRWDVDWPIPGQ